MDVQAWIDQEHATIAQQIRRRGWTIQYVGGEACSRPGCTCPPDDEPPFAYTTGLFGLGHPELLIIGVGPEIAAVVLNTLGDRVRRGGQLLPGLPIEIAGWNHRIIPEPVPNPGDVLLWANRFYDRPPEHSIPALQLSYDDEAGRFPWEAGCNVAQLQPRPGTFTG